MKPLRHHVLGLLAILLLLGGCTSGTEPASTRAIEERYLGMGESQQLFRYAQDLLNDGRYREAYYAFHMAEKKAYTEDLRKAARVRRMWLQEVIKAYEEGATPPPPPVVLTGPPIIPALPLEPIVPPEKLPPPSDNPPRDPDGQILLPPVGGQSRY